MKVRADLPGAEGHPWRTVMLAAPASPGGSPQHLDRSCANASAAGQLPRYPLRAIARSRDRSPGERAVIHLAGQYWYQAGCLIALAISHLVQTDQVRFPDYPRVFYFLVASQTFSAAQEEQRSWPIRWDTIVPHQLLGNCPPEGGSRRSAINGRLRSI